MVRKRTNRSNVKFSKKHSKFGETFRYFTWEEWQRFLDAIDKYEHKLMFRLLYELGARVGEFVKIRIKHIDFTNSTIFFPAANTKTQKYRTSHLPRGLLNELKDYLKQQDFISKRDERIRNPEQYILPSPAKRKKHITENRVRQIFRKYLVKAGLDREYGVDSKGRKLHKFSVHSLRHTHCMHYINIYKVPVPIVQKQVGHRELETTMIYCEPTDEIVGKEYEKARSEGDIKKPLHG